MERQTAGECGCFTRKPLPLAPAHILCAPQTERVAGSGRITGWNSDDPDAILSVFADDFYFKGLGMYEPERTDTASRHSYVESLVPLHVRIERNSDSMAPLDGTFTFTVVVSSDDLAPRFTWMELEVEADKIRGWRR